MRVYVPVTAAQLAPLVDDGELGAPSAAGRTGFAVTPELRAWYVADGAAADPAPDEEDLEYAAAAEAARACLRLLSADADAVPRRIVIAADVDDREVAVRDDLDRGVVRIRGTLHMSSIAAVFADDAEAEATVREAADAIDAAELGDNNAQEKVDDAEGFELSWYATTELPALRADLVG